MLNEKNQRELAYLVTVDEIREIPGYDRICQYRTGGWWCVSGKGDYQVGDIALYIEIDSLCPYTDEFAFLNEAFNEEGIKVKPDRHKIKTQKFAKGTAISQGLLCPLKDFPKLQGKPVGYFCTEQLGITYYEAEDNKRKADYSKYTSMQARHKKFFKTKLGKWLMKREWGRKLCFFFLGKKKDKKTGERAFPTHFPYIHKSDEERVENMPWILENKEPWVKTLKIDGTSTTFILERKGKNKFEFYVLSRNVRQLKEDQACFHEINVYWEMAKKYNIENFLKEQLELHSDWKYVSIQGETAGPLVQANPHNLKERQFYGFNFIDSQRGRWNSVEARDYVAKWGIQWVPIVDENYILPDSMEEFKASADGPCELPGATGLREGYVYRDLKGEKSFKNVSNQFLLSKK